MLTEEGRALRALEEIDAERVALANELHKLVTTTPRPADADDRIAAITGRQAELKEKADAIHSEHGTGL